MASVKQRENLISVCHEYFSIYKAALGLRPIAKTLEIKKALEIETKFSRNTKLKQHFAAVFVVIIVIFKKPLGKEVLWAKM